MLIELWPNGNGEGYILATEIVGVANIPAPGSKGGAVRDYFVIIKGGNNIKVSREGYRMAEEYLDKRSDEDDIINKAKPE